VALKKKYITSRKDHHNFGGYEARSDVAPSPMAPVPSLVLAKKREYNV
jgi:hypothetical protein